MNKLLLCCAFFLFGCDPVKPNKVVGISIYDIERKSGNIITASATIQNPFDKEICLPKTSIEELELFPVRYEDGAKGLIIKQRRDSFPIPFYFPGTKIEYELLRLSPEAILDTVAKLHIEDINSLHLKNGEIIRPPIDGTYGLKASTSYHDCSEIQIEQHNGKEYMITFFGEDSDTTPSFLTSEISGSMHLSFK